MKFQLKNFINSNRASDSLRLLGLIAICIILFLGGLDKRSLWEPDEARYAEIAREMLISGDWITPRLNYVKYFEKPPLTYWLVALSFKLFGISSYSAHLVPAFCGMLTVTILFFFGRRMWNSQIGFFAAFCLATSLMFLTLSRILLVDITLCLGITVALWGGWILYQGDHWGRYIFWGGCAVGFLSKGLLGLGLPIMVSVIYAILTKEFSWLKKIVQLRGLVFFLLLSLPWIILISLINPEFPKFFFIDENLGRLLTIRHQRYQPFYFYILILPGAFSPWTALLPWALIEEWPSLSSWRSKQARPWLFTIVWISSLLIFFSLSLSKMTHYILPILPALALLLSKPLSKFWNQDWYAESPKHMRWGILTLTYLIFLSGLLFLVIPSFVLDINYIQAGLFLLFGPLIFTSLALIIFLIQRQNWGLWISCLIILLILVSLSNIVNFYLNDYRSQESLLVPIKNKLRENDLLVNYGDYYYGTMFYSARRIVMVRNWGELEFGRHQDPEASKWFIPDDANFLILLQDPQIRILAISETQAYQCLKKSIQNIPKLILFEWNRKGDKILFSNRPYQ